MYVATIQHLNYRTRIHNTQFASLYFWHTCDLETNQTQNENVDPTQDYNHAQWWTFFWAPYTIGQCPGDQILGHGVLMTQKKKKKLTGHQICRKLNLWRRSWTKHAKLKSTSLIISLGTATTEWFLIKKLLSVQFYSCYSLQSIMCFYSALQSKHGVPPVWMYLSTHVLHWPEARTWW